MRVPTKSTIASTVVVATLGLAMFTASAMSLASEPATTTTTSTTTSTTLPPTTTSTTTTTTILPNKLRQRSSINGCPQFEGLAAKIGWPIKQIDTLSFVMWRESRCHPTSWNKADPYQGSMGLTQINSFWCLPNRYTEHGWLQDHNILTSCQDLFTPEVSLKAALAIWEHSGWSPWRL